MNSTLVAKVGARRGQGSPGRDGERARRAGPDKLGPGDSHSDEARAEQAHNSADTTINALRDPERKCPRMLSEGPKKKGVRQGNARDKEGRKR
jgi:hypothetical protein